MSKNSYLPSVPSLSILFRHTRSSKSGFFSCQKFFKNIFSTRFFTLPSLPSPFVKKSYERLKIAIKNFETKNCPKNTTYEKMKDFCTLYYYVLCTYLYIIYIFYMSFFIYHLSRILFLIFIISFIKNKKSLIK